MYLQLRVRVIYPYQYTETVYLKVSTNACWYSSVNNAGLGLITPLQCTTMEMAKELFEVNFFGTLRLIQAVLPGMKARQNGCIINNSSHGGIVSCPFLELYCSSKFAMEGLIEGMAPLMLHFNIRY